MSQVGQTSGVKSQTSNIRRSLRGSVGVRGGKCTPLIGHFTFFAWLHGQTGREIPPGEVTFFDVKRYRDELEDARKKPATVNRALSALRQFFDWMVAQGHMASSPAASVKQIRVKRRTPKSLSKQEVYLLQRAAVARRQLAESQANSDGETEPRTTPAIRVA
jgi:integrase